MATSSPACTRTSPPSRGRSIGSPSKKVVYDTTELDYNSLGGMGTWAAFVAFTQIAETIDGDITAESFFEAASNTSELDLNGMVPVLDFTQEWTDGLEGYQRLFNRSVVFSTLENGKVVPLTTEFEDVGDLATGNAG